MNSENFSIPKHVAIILDGYGRWAQNRGKSRSEGHKAGLDRLQSLSEYIIKKGVKVLSVFAFSTENFKRDKKEVDYLMNLFSTGLKKSLEVFNSQNIKVIVSGRRDKLPTKVLKTIDELQNKTCDNTAGILNICLNYGGKAEIVDTTKKLAKKVHDNEITIEDITEDLFSEYLYNPLPPVDLMIRTGGEIRISNFMIYECAYAEFYFTDTYFPDFDEEEFDKALNCFNNRNRRFGGINDKKGN